ncbi:MAG: preprotein translocase subunit SecD [Bacteroidetes bacterium ADurb.Bin408]|nr:MAG: preprotein translocase subunit SecD [Bacteroidetes bacterium ADurb.Bin408]
MNKTDNDSLIEIEIKGVPDPHRAKNLVNTTGALAFWETYELAEIFQYLDQANKALIPLYKDSIQIPEKKDTNKNEADPVSELGYEKNSQPDPEFISQNPLFSCLYPNVAQREDGQAYPQQGAVVGLVNISDTAKINTMLNLKEVKMLFPRDLFFMWTIKAVDEEGKYLQLVAVRQSSRDGMPPMSGAYIVNAKAEKGMSGNNEILMEMNSEGAHIWKRLTSNNIGKALAIAIDNNVYAAPMVQAAIDGGKSLISGNFTAEEAADMAIIIKNGALPLHTCIIQVEVSNNK